MKLIALIAVGIAIIATLMEASGNKNTEQHNKFKADLRSGAFRGSYQEWIDANKANKTKRGK